MLELRNITKVYNPGTVTEMCRFDKFNLTIGDKEFLSIVGSNGSGKTSLLNIICGSIPIEGGEVLIGGESIDRLKEHQRYRKMGRVYQNPAVGTCPNLTLLENMSLADNKGRPFNLGTGINKARVPYYKEQLSMLGLGLENKLNEKVGSLSGGQRQAAALIMSTLTPIDFLILDEHTAALDPKTAETIMQLTAKVIKEKQITAMMVTHNLRYAVEYGSRLIMMDNGQIVLEKTGSEKEKLIVDDILKVFTDISIECGN
ncbi:MAG TPA: ATP-binding cassette domain-containing protein [Bacillota bacterium]|nr:ATP-binding cassette domain-containing protein [Bacillota bacterium]